MAGANTNSWPGFRGSNQSHAGAPLPLHWSAESGVAWETALRGTGQSSPVIWNDRLFVTSVDGASKEQLHLLCLELSTGKELWRRQWESTQPETASDYISKAAPTPAVDAQRAYVLFESGDLFAVTHDGAPVWQRQLGVDYGRFEGNHGQASSPVLVPGAVAILVDQKADSYILALDRDSGETAWKTSRDTSSAWSTPVLIERNGRLELIASASGSLAAYDPKTGSLLWAHEGLDGNNVPSPTTDGSLFLIGSRKRGENRALRAESDSKDSFVTAWIAEAATSGFGSPLLHDGRAYFVSDAGIVYCYQAESGKLLWDSRIGDSTWASPLASDGRLYFFGKNGITTVMKPSDTPEVLAENKLVVDSKDRVYGYAVAPGKLVFRLGNQLICVATGAPAEAAL
jgi:outer membrane protein assembly factor BamB